MPTNTWDLAVVELVYYIPAVVPVLYLLWVYRQTSLVGWLLLAAFVLLQVIGAGMTVGAGEEGQPPNIATILIGVGLSPLLVGVAGILHGWTKAIAYYRTKSSKRRASIIVVAYHIAVVAAIAIYATGLSNSSTDSSGQTMAEAGILLLLVLLLLLIVAFIFLMCTSATQPLRPLLFAIAISLLLLKIRILYHVVVVFLDRTNGGIALRVIFQFLPGAFILLALVTGGVMSARKQKEVYETLQQSLPLELESQGSRK